MVDSNATLLKLLSRATAAYERTLNRELRARLDDQLRPAHYAVFRHLDPAGSRISALAETAGMTQQSMGELVAHLERCGLVERQVDPVDRRARLVVLTDRGRAALDVAAQRIRSIEQMIADALGERGLGDLRRALALVDEALAAESTAAAD
ncbi:MarR family winged helix-turn-helix transcriptional regulator [Nocardia iowensis]|uniref:MarR family winged helix-turn-helix transcriptional regulator n=1 Tax=Nocardia iowensis TaxID=204891 RepID=A0ABX8RXP2_NOCIO|nr:MarR family winged helix-turn-helix transcriptional regulator [Nocardia iowensis]QXN93732.1 MarR family winged helix-turn-helix transcriptional regulator [Nocardia iowensis]